MTRNSTADAAVHLGDTGPGLTKNWALQMSVALPTNGTGTAQRVLCFDNGSNDGLQFNLSNSNDGSVYGFSYSGWTGWGSGNLSSILQTSDMVTLTFVNYEGAIYFGAGDTWATFNNGTADSPTNVANGALDKLLLGGGKSGQNGPAKDTSYEFDDIAVYSFDSSTVSIADVRNALIIPGPATATLGLLALAGLAARRRRK